jgi:hypothetical protein
MQINSRQEIQEEITANLSQRVIRNSPAIRNIIREQVEARMAEQAGNQWAADDHRARAARIADRIGR